MEAHRNLVYKKGAFMTQFSSVQFSSYSFRVGVITTHKNMGSCIINPETLLIGLMIDFRLRLLYTTTFLGSATTTS